jgi:hypothetical protein
MYAQRQTSGKPNNPKAAEIRQTKGPKQGSSRRDQENQRSQTGQQPPRSGKPKVPNRAAAAEIRQTKGPKQGSSRRDQANQRSQTGQQPPRLDKPKVPNKAVKIGQGHICMRQENVIYNNGCTKTDFRISATSEWKYNGKLCLVMGQLRPLRIMWCYLEEAVSCLLRSLSKSGIIKTQGTHLLLRR